MTGLVVNRASGNLFVCDDGGGLLQLEVEGGRRILRDFKRVVEGGVKTVLTMNGGGYLM